MNVLPKVERKDFNNGVVHEKSSTDNYVTTLRLPIKSAQWEEVFNTAEKPMYVQEWHNDVGFMRHMYELYQPTEQKTVRRKMEWVGEKEITEEDIEWGVANPVPIKKKTLEAAVTYPFDYRCGITTLDQTGIFTHNEWVKDTALTKVG